MQYHLIACRVFAHDETETSAPSRTDAAETRATDLAFASRIRDVALGMVTRNTQPWRWHKRTDARWRERERERRWENRQKMDQRTHVTLLWVLSYIRSRRDFLETWSNLEHWLIPIDSRRNFEKKSSLYAHEDLWEISGKLSENLCEVYLGKFPGDPLENLGLWCIFGRSLWTTFWQMFEEFLRGNIFGRSSPQSFSLSVWKMSKTFISFRRWRTISLENLSRISFVRKRPRTSSLDGSDHWHSTRDLHRFTVCPLNSSRRLWCVSLTPKFVIISLIFETHSGIVRRNFEKQSIIL